MHAHLPSDWGFIDRADTARQLQEESASVRAQSEEARVRFRAASARTVQYVHQAWRQLRELREESATYLGK